MARAAVRSDNLRIPLKSEFRFVHEPIRARTAAQFVGRKAELEELTQRLLFSDGGSFLVTGYRGVGKTSFVNQVAAQLRDDSRWANDNLGDTRVLHVELNLARALGPQELMYHVLERLYETLDDSGILKTLPLQLREKLELAYVRTSVSLSRNSGTSDERTRGLPEWEFGAPPFKASVKGFARKTTRTQSEARAYLAYDDRAAEHDLIRIARWLSDGFVPIATGWRRLLRRRAKLQRLKIVFVFDELDKLADRTSSDRVAADKADNAEPEPPIIDQLLNALKPLFTTSGIAFVFVAGKDLHDRWLEDVARGDSVYESVFSYDRYLPLMWTDVNDLFDCWVDRDRWKQVADPAEIVFESFRNFLAYIGRGIPRRMLRAFNQFVRWDAHGPALVLDRQALRRIRLYAGLQGLLAANDRRLFGSGYEEVRGTLADRQRLGVYYLVDWMLRRGALPFAFADAVGASRALSQRIAPAEEVAPDVVKALIDVLLTESYLEEFAPAPRTNNVDVDIVSSTAVRYRVPTRRLAELGASDATVEQDAVAANAPSMPPLDGRYALNEQLARGGMSIVYRAVDLVSGQDVAVKLLSDEFVHNAAVRKIFSSEAEIQRNLNHPGIVRVIQASTEGDVPYIVMELIVGFDLQQMLATAGRLAPNTACDIARRAAEAAAFVHEKGYAALDIKPSNILLQRVDGRIFLADLGAAVRIGETGPGALIGTPAYMAPEALGPDAKADPRSDVYSLGVVLYEMLTGERPFTGSVAELSLSEDIDSVLRHCLATHPEERFQTMTALASALQELAVGPDPDVTMVAVQKHTQITQQGRDITIVPGLEEAAEDAPPTSAPPPNDVREGPALVVHGPGIPDTLFYLDRDVVTIGRTPSNDLALPDPQVSREHAKIMRVGDTYTITDLNTLNGTRVNGQPVLTSAVLSPGDVIGIGDIQLRFVAVRREQDHPAPIEIAAR